MEQKTGYDKLLEAMRLIEEKSRSRFEPFGNSDFLVCADREAYLDMHIRMEHNWQDQNTKVHFTVNPRRSGNPEMDAYGFEAVFREMSNAWELLLELEKMDITVTHEELSQFGDYIRQREQQQEQAGGPEMGQTM